MQDGSLSVSRQDLLVKNVFCPNGSGGWHKIFLVKNISCPSGSGGGGHKLFGGNCDLRSGLPPPICQTTAKWKCEENYWNFCTRCIISIIWQISFMAGNSCPVAPFLEKKIIKSETRNCTKLSNILQLWSDGSKKRVPCSLVARKTTARNRFAAINLKLGDICFKEMSLTLTMSFKSSYIFYKQNHFLIRKVSEEWSEVLRLVLAA